MNSRHLWIALVCCVSVIHSVEASAKSYKIWFTGWSMPSQEANLNGDTADGVEATLFGKGSFGDTSNHSVLDSVLSGSCETKEGPEAGLLYTYVTHTNILRASSGHLLFRELNDSQVSTVCIDPINLTAKAKIFLDIVGGTGKFRKAEGQSELTYRIRFLNGQNAISGREKGRLEGVKWNHRDKKKDRDDDKDDD